MRANKGYSNYKWRLDAEEIIMENKLSFNENVVETLKNEERLLSGKMKIELEKGNYQMYKQLINAYSDVVRLIKEYDFQLMDSKYGKKLDNGTFIDCVSIWEQNADVVCKNIKEFGRVDLDKIRFNKGDRILFEGKKYLSICIDNEYAVFAEVNDKEGVNYRKITVLPNDIERNGLNYERLN
jgi:hypothetical protein